MLLLKQIATSGENRRNFAATQTTIHTSGRNSGAAFRTEIQGRYSSVEIFERESTAFFNVIEGSCMTTESQRRFRAGREAVLILYRANTGASPKNRIALEGQVRSFYTEFIAANNAISADDKIISLCISEFFILNTSEPNGRIVLGQMAYVSRPSLEAERDKMSDTSKAYFDDVIVPLAKEHELFVLLTASSSREVKEWHYNLETSHLGVSNNALGYCIARVIKLSSEIADFIREKNIQEEKELKLLEKRREELAGFKLPAALRRAIADQLGIKPEDLDPAVARREAEKASVG